MRITIEGLSARHRAAASGSAAALKPVSLTVEPGEQIAVMGRTTNTKEGISKERAHVHFELDLLVNDRFANWYGKKFPGQRNDHGNWNGQNLIAVDPLQILREQQRLGSGSPFSSTLMPRR